MVLDYDNFVYLCMTGSLWVPHPQDHDAYYQGLNVQQQTWPSWYGLHLNITSQFQITLLMTQYSIKDNRNAKLFYRKNPQPFIDKSLF